MTTNATEQQAFRDSFDYEHGGTKDETDAQAIVYWLAERGVTAEVEYGGDLHRVWCDAIDGYFWPLDATEASWNAAA